MLRGTVYHGFEGYRTYRDTVLWEDPSTSLDDINVENIQMAGDTEVNAVVSFMLRIDGSEEQPVTVGSLFVFGPDGKVVSVANSYKFRTSTAAEDEAKTSELEMIAGGYEETAKWTSLSDGYREVKVLGEGGFGKVVEVERLSDGLHLAAKSCKTKIGQPAPDQV